MSVLDFLLLPFEFIIVGSLACCAVLLTRVAVGDIVEAMTRKRFAFSASAPTCLACARQYFGSANLGIMNTAPDLASVTRLNNH